MHPQYSAEYNCTSFKYKTCDLGTTSTEVFLNLIRRGGRPAARRRFFRPAHRAPGAGISAAGDVRLGPMGRQNIYIYGNKQLTMSLGAVASPRTCRALHAPPSPKGPRRRYLGSFQLAYQHGGARSELAKGILLQY